VLDIPYFTIVLPKQRTFIASKDLRSDGHERGENTASPGDYFALIPSVAILLP